MKYLLINQCFHPDVVSSAQHLTDLALGLAQSGHEVTVLTGRRGYDNRELHFLPRENWNGIEVIRIGSSGFGKGARWRRALDFGSFLLACALRLLLMPRFDAVVALTSPPLISFLAAAFTRLKGGSLFLWIMDLNPDEAIAAGWLSEGSIAARWLSRLFAFSAGQASRLIVLDRFMKDRLLNKGVPEDKIAVIPPWSHDNHVCFDEEGRSSFRSAHNLSDKFVVMYSGNHSPCHPLHTLLQAAARLADRPEIHFCFVGGGSEYAKAKVFAKEQRLANTSFLPYQPLEKLAASLSAADLHLVVMGDPYVGIVHPCKIYNILSVGIPFLYIGPAESHVGDIIPNIQDTAFAGFARHGDVEAVVDHILKCATQIRSQSGRRGTRPDLAMHYSMPSLLPEVIGVLDASRTGWNLSIDN
jgi:colanic acid biosynthesis glycosyl transferase WcaI